MRKKLAFIDSSLDDLREFPESPRQEMGYQLDRVQQGLDPDDWKPFTTVGAGVREIRVQDSDGIYRAMYVAKFEEAVYVLHCFQKKSQATSKSDVDLAKRRFKNLYRSGKMKTQTFDSVFDAISDTPEQAENMKIRARLMTVLNTWIENQGYSQAEAAAVLGVTQPRISELARGKIQVFSVDKLISMMAHAGMYIQNMDIRYPGIVAA